ncbi:MAG: lipopolysaccharide assembly protein LapA domain-containing protein [Marinosulfonomonas sp.]
MRYIKYAFLAALAVILISVALANRDTVTLRVFTDGLANVVGVQNTITLPLFIVIFASIIVGILIGFVWEWFREHKHRVDASQQRKARERLEKQVGQMKTDKSAPKDDVLALLEQ